MSGKYDPATFIQRTFHDARERFLRDEESPVVYFRSCVKQIEELEPSVKAWASLRLEDALRDAAASEARYRAKRPLSLIDGMPIGIKDVLSTKDMPTNFGIIGNENHTRFDSPIAQALRDAGAIILGKTTTTELAFGDPSETKNPFDLTRTPGGSSSGSGAAVGARMVPAAIGTQVGGSLIRPASYNANFALKPTIGGLNRGEDLNYSHLACGVHAGSLIDMWRVTIEIAKRVGGDPGYLGVVGNDDLANACVPQTIALIETEGWSETEQTTRDGFHAFRTQLESAGITTLTKDNNVHIRRFEQVIANAKELTLGIIAWEGQWYLGRMLDTFGDALRGSVRTLFAHGRGMTLDDYRLLLAEREAARASMAALARDADVLCTLSATGPAPSMKSPANHDPSLPYGVTGSFAFNVAVSLLGVPAISLPLLSIDGMPVGIQVIGQMHQDEYISRVSQWIVNHIDPITIGQPG